MVNGWIKSLGGGAIGAISPAAGAGGAAVGGATYAGVREIFESIIDPGFVLFVFGQD